MATVPSTSIPPEVDYPDSDGKPMAETPLHRDNMIAMIDVFRRRFAGDPMTYISGNMFLYYEQGNRWKNVSPDVFVARDVSDRLRRVYKTWEEGKGPDLVIEVTSASTRREDLETKFSLYRDTLKVFEYFLFDPEAEYLDPPLQGYRLVEGRYEPIAPVDGRLPSAVTGLHFEGSGGMIQAYDPVVGQRVLTSPEALPRVELARQEAELLAQKEHAARLAAEQENERLRRELEDLRRQRSGNDS